jgi:hypothetical protein
LANGVAEGADAGCDGVAVAEVDADGLLLELAPESSRTPAWRGKAMAARKIMGQPRSIITY